MPRIKLEEIASARSGDKGEGSNVGVIAHSDAAYAFLREALTEDEIVVDIGRAHDALKATLAPLNYANLDALPALAGKKTTTEFLCKHIFDAMAGAAAGGALGPGGDGSERIRVTLNESHVAKAWFEGSVAAGAGA